MHKFLRQTVRFIRNEDGIATVWAIGWLILCFAIAGLSIDVSNAWKVKMILQSTADAAAHAGGLELGNVNNAGIKAAVIISANEYASLNMNPARYGDVLVDTDIAVGYWNAATETFTEMVDGDLNPPRAVRVTTRQDGVSSTKVGTFFLRFAGFDAFTIATVSIVESFVSVCEKDGLKAYGVINMSTQQLFKPRYCVHGESGVKMSDLNTFEDGAIASMVDLNDCGPDITHCTDEYNPGIESALTQDSSQTFGKILRIDETIAALQNRDSKVIADLKYIDPRLDIQYIDVADFDASVLVANSIHVVKCTQPNQTLNMGGLATLNNQGGGNDSGTDTIVQQITKTGVVVVALGCDFTFDKTIHYEDATFATTSTSRQTVSGSAGVVLGRNDGCDDGGEVALITKGDIKFAAQLAAYDLEMIVAGSVSLASLGNSDDSIHQGTSIIAGGDINITTKHTFSGCYDTETTLDTKFTLRYVR